MAKKKEEQNEPIISSIPVPPSDSALVIDLPDGQKLLVGKIETGTVIEVATWRGTGRPDSRTNRLMLGMSNENDAKVASETQEVNRNKEVQNKFPEKLIHLLLKYGKIVHNFTRSSLVKFLTFIKDKKIFNSDKKPKPADEIYISDGKKKPAQEDDFEIDFQRILDEVNQRRNTKTSKPAESKSKVFEKENLKSKSKSGTGKKKKK